MSFKEKLTQGVNRHLKNLKSMYDDRVAIAEKKAKADLAKAKTKSEREQAMLKLRREKMKAQQELYEAKVATQKAKVALEKARKEAGDLTLSERLSGVGEGLFKSFTKPPRKRRTVKRVTKKRTTKR